MTLDPRKPKDRGATHTHTHTRVCRRVKAARTPLEWVKGRVTHEKLHATSIGTRSIRPNRVVFLPLAAGRADVSCRRRTVIFDTRVGSTINKRGKKKRSRTVHGLFLTKRKNRSGRTNDLFHDVVYAVRSRQKLGPPRAYAHNTTNKRTDSGRTRGPSSRVILVAITGRR